MAFFFCMRYRMLYFKWNLIAIKYKQIEVAFCCLQWGSCIYIWFDTFRILCYLVLNISLRPDMYRIVMFE